jgi:hypothetical protein
VATILPPAPDQPEPPYWRITELYFQSVDDLQKGSHPRRVKRPLRI